MSLAINSPTPWSPNAGLPAQAPGLNSGSANSANSPSLSSDSVRRMSTTLPAPALMRPESIDLFPPNAVPDAGATEMVKAENGGLISVAVAGGAIALGAFVGIPMLHELSFGRQIGELQRLLKHDSADNQAADSGAALQKHVAIAEALERHHGESIANWLVEEKTHNQLPKAVELIPHDQSKDSEFLNKGPELTKLERTVFGKLIDLAHDDADHVNTLHEHLALHNELHPDHDSRALTPEEKLAKFALVDHARKERHKQFLQRCIDPILVRASHLSPVVR